MSIRRTSTKGFTLIELLIVVSIVGLLVVIAYPSYTSYLLKSHRADARSALILDQIILERCYTHDFSYSGDCPELANFPHLSSRGYYMVAVSGLTPATYQLTATPTASQQADKVCSSFTIDESNRKVAINNAGISQPDCWTT